jgi:ribonuclease-3
VIGAVFLDGGYSAAKAVVAGLMKMCSAGEESDPGKDAKTRLQELLQSRGDKPPAYRLTRRTGPDHASSFEVEATLVDGSVISVGRGGSIKAAEFEAAREALASLGFSEERQPKT